MFSVALLLLLLLSAGSYVKSEHLTDPASVTLQPGQSLTITCQVSYSVDKYYTAWIRQPAGKGLQWIGMKYTGDTQFKDSLKPKFSISLDSSTNTVTLNGQNLQPEDTAVYYCTRWWGGVVPFYAAFGYWGKGTTVTVTSGKTNAPTVFPLTQCDSGTGDTVTVGCLATNFTPSPVTFKWSNNGNDLTDFIQYPSVQTGNYFTGVSQIQVKRADWNTNSTFKCTATHQGQEVTADVKPPEVFYQLPTLEVLSICEDNAQTASFSCFAKDFSAREYDIKWLKNEQEISNSVYEIKTPSGKTQYENGTTVYNAASFLKVQASEWTDPGTKFTCEFKGKDGTGDMYVNASLTYTPQKENGEVKPEHLMDIDLIPPTLEKMFLNKQGELVCKVIPKPHEGNFVKVSWEDDKGHELIESMNVEGKKGPFSLSLNILYEEWSAGFKRFCVVHHTELPTPAKTPYERKSGGKPQHPSVFLLAPVEQTKNKEVTLTCLVKDFFPKEIIVSWLVNDKPADPETIRTTNPLESEGSYSVYGKISVNLDKWMNDKEVYSCVVYHESVINTTGVLIRSMVERSDEKTTMVNLNMNIGQTCMAQ